VISKEEINEIILSVLKDIINPSTELSITSVFIGFDSSIESIDIVQIIAALEAKLEEKGLENCDLLEKVFERDRLTFEEMSELIIKEFS
tara:strand:+ start:552 stop:818 length:267 start_codon:yes stop_codon:yes gene_type:complete